MGREYADDVIELILSPVGVKNLPTTEQLLSHSFFGSPPPLHNTSFKAHHTSLIA